MKSLRQHLVWKFPHEIEIGDIFISPDLYPDIIFMALSKPTKNESSFRCNYELSVEHSGNKQPIIWNNFLLGQNSAVVMLQNKGIE